MEKNKQIKFNQGEIAIYRPKGGEVKFEVKLEQNTLWLDAHQMARIFGIDRTVIVKHINNIYKDSELSEKSTCAIFAQVAADGKIRKMNLYNLDMVISVGYRVNSRQATQFRMWATKVLKEHIIKGYTINRRQIAQNYDSFMKAVASVQNLLPEHVVLDPKLILDLIKEFAGTWMALDAYDRNKLVAIGNTKKSVKLSGNELEEAIAKLRAELMKKGEATEIFAQERKGGSVEGIIGNVMQSFGGKPVYATAEERAAHLLYFMVKNHPFIDGNKRSGAFAFVWFLRKARIKGAGNINPSALTALTLLIAESQPNKKSQMTALITTLLTIKK